MAEPQQVLLIDNDEQKRQFLENSLRRAGFEVATAASHTEALRQLEHQQPRLVVSELQTPSVDGISLCQKLEGRDDTAHIPVLFLAPNDHPSTAAQARAVGADDVVAKPAFVSDIVERAQTLIANLEHHTEAAPAAFPAFRVSLHDVDMVGLLEDVSERVERFVIDISQANGTIGSLTVSNGIVVHAELGNEKPREALQKVLRLAAGMVHVRPGKSSRFRTLTIPIRDCRERFVSRNDAQTLSLQELEALHSALRSDIRTSTMRDRSDELALGQTEATGFLGSDIALDSGDDEAWSMDANWDDVSPEHLTRTFRDATFEIDENVSQQPEAQDITGWIVGLAALTVAVALALHTALS